MGSNELSTQEIREVQEVIANATLASVDYWDISASRLDDGDPDRTDEDNLTISVQFRRVSEGFGVRLFAELVLSNGRARACVAGEYKLSEGFDPSALACQTYVNEVAIMTIYPYLREAMATVTARVFGDPVHLPVVERGEIRVSLVEDDD